MATHLLAAIAPDHRSLPSADHKINGHNHDRQRNELIQHIPSAAVISEENVRERNGFTNKPVLQRAQSDFNPRVRSQENQLRIQDSQPIPNDDSEATVAGSNPEDGWHLRHGWDYSAEQLRQLSSVCKMSTGSSFLLTTSTDGFRS